MKRSKLQRQTNNILSIFFAQYTIRENYRPSWLTTSDGGHLELDFFIEELDVAIEVQGDQHYAYSPFFHKSYQEFLDQQKRDKAKMEICARMGVTLYPVDTLDAVWSAILQLISSDQKIKSDIDVFWPSPHPARWGRIKAYSRIIRREMKREHPRLDRIKKYENKITALCVEDNINRACIDNFLGTLSGTSKEQEPP